MIRLFVAAALAQGERVVLSPEQAHYLTRVMRLAEGDELALFNGRDGEWLARMAAVGKRGCVVEPSQRLRPQSAGPDLELIIALVKRPRLETIVEKAAELGAARVCPVTTERTNAERARVERLTAIAIEAAEQTGRLDVPLVDPPQRLEARLAAWPPGRQLMFCDESGDAPVAAEALSGRAAGPWAILIGPEGGFSQAERKAIRAVPEAVPVSLGPRILRADTAAIAALTLWQSALGDWRGA
ncbi:MAG TPA: 16S rRNA (uracil(1498)-N(3))-methyltransferase [Caulobacteraceae bacterium]|nr:16S rRNA (uracil(1498)-N(3))-methyltransferase [Caulobacteraceae bacterium]